MKLPSFLSVGDATTFKNRIKIIGLSGIALVSLMVYYCMGIFDSLVMAAFPLVVFFGIYLFSRLIKTDGTGVSISLKQGFTFDRHRSFRHLWLLTLIGLIVGFIQAEWKMLNLIDLITIGGCTCVILNAPEDPAVYKPVLKIFAIASVFYAASVWLQVLFPGIYRIYLNMLQDVVAQRIIGFENYVTGFTTNPGHTATYIALGIFSFLSCGCKKKWQTYLVVAFLIVTMAWVGMRMPLLAMGVAMLLFLFLRISPKNRWRFMLVLLGLCMVAVWSVVLFRRQLEAIPIFRRTLYSLTAMLNGQDFTSGRSALYKNAIEQFLQHPVIGIGWGEYRHTVLGTVTKETRFDVHNIYLQLLCETGIVGFTCFVVPMISSLFATVRSYYRMVKAGDKTVWNTLLAFSLMFQIYFLTFGMADNSLYNMCEQIPYFISCSITVAYLCNKNNQVMQRR